MAASVHHRLLRGELGTGTEFSSEDPETENANDADGAEATEQAGAAGDTEVLE